MNNNFNEAGRWQSQAQADLKVARWDFEGKFWWEVEIFVGFTFYVRR